jgi:hypothetical protein
MNSTQVIGNMVVVYLWCSDIEPAWAEVWMNSTRHLISADAPLAHDGVGVVVPPGAHVSHHTGALCRERGQRSSYPLILTLILMAFFPAKVQELVVQKTISYFYNFQQFLGFVCRFKMSEQ